jgi:DNA-binding transcriptional regulator LsrR (DeoR family)
MPPSKSRTRPATESFASDGNQPVAGPSPDLLVKLATRFYLDGQTQVELARELGMDPSTVSRYLRRARDEGIVRIQIQRPPAREESLSQEIAALFNLRRAVVVADEVARAAADFIGSHLRNGMRLGLSWGRLLSQAVYLLPQECVSALEISLLHGGVGNAGPGIQGHELARHVASLYRGSTVTYLHAPLLVDSADIKQAMLRDRSIQAALRSAAAAELALVGIGTLDSDAPLVRYGHLSPGDRDRLLAARAVGDVATHFFTSDGEPVRVLDERLVAVDREGLDSIPTVVAMAAGRQKTHAILGALRSGLVDVLVTDEETARLVLSSATA